MRDRHPGGAPEDVDPPPICPCRRSQGSAAGTRLAGGPRLGWPNWRWMAVDAGFARSVNGTGIGPWLSTSGAATAVTGMTPAIRSTNRDQHRREPGKLDLLLAQPTERPAGFARWAHEWSITTETGEIGRPAAGKILSCSFRSATPARQSPRSSRRRSSAHGVPSALNASTSHAHGVGLWDLGRAH